MSAIERWTDRPTSTRTRFIPVLDESASTGTRIGLWNSSGTPSASIPIGINSDPFEQQKAAFGRIPPLLLEPYRGLWVVSVDGRILDSDQDLQTLSKRFFDANGDIDVYITKVLPRARYRRPAPRLR